MAEAPTIKIEVAWSRRARRRGAHRAPKGWRDVTEYVARENSIYEQALRRYWAAHARPLAADGLSYHRRCLARRRRSR